MSEDTKTRVCPICRKTFTDMTYKPFCSKRCADIDLGNWFNGEYRFEAHELDEQDAAELAELADKGLKESAANH